MGTPRPLNSSLTTTPPESSDGYVGYVSRATGQNLGPGPYPLRPSEGLAGVST